MLDDVPTDCDVGMKKDSKGYKSTWVGYKHLDVSMLPADVRLPARPSHSAASRANDRWHMAAYGTDQHSRSTSDTNPRVQGAALQRIAFSFPSGSLQRAYGG